MGDVQFFRRPDDPEAELLEQRPRPAIRDQLDFPAGQPLSQGKLLRHQAPRNSSPPEDWING